MSTVVPWESWYAGLGGNPLEPTKTFKYNTMFFFGLPEFGKTFIPMWNRIPNNKVVAEMFPNDADGNAFRAGWPPMMQAAGYTPVDGGAYPDGTTDYTSMISKFKHYGPLAPVLPGRTLFPGISCTHHLRKSGPRRLAVRRGGHRRLPRPLEPHRRPTPFGPDGPGSLEQLDQRRRAQAALDRTHRPAPLPHW